MVSAGCFTIPPDHPCLAGHFPGQPIVPGVVLLDHALSLIGHAIPEMLLAGIPSVKFLWPVLPGHMVEVSYEGGSLAHTGSSARLTFVCTVEGRAVVRGSFALRESVE